jgi:hypothetical protein
LEFCSFVTTESQYRNDSALSATAAAAVGGFVAVAIVATGGLVVWQSYYWDWAAATYAIYPLEQYSMLLDAKGMRNCNCCRACDGNRGPVVVVCSGFVVIATAVLTVLLLLLVEEL